MEKLRFVLLDIDGSTRWIVTDRKSMLDDFHAAIGCDMVEQVTTPFGFCMLVDESGKIKNPPQPFNPYASRLYRGTLYGDPIVGPVVFVRIGLVDGEYDWCSLHGHDLFRLASVLGIPICSGSL